MARIARVVVPGLAHHVTQRGNRCMPTFFSDDDYRAYLELVGQWCRQEGVAVWAYCLMPNHIHLILVPSRAEGLSRALGEAHRRYTRRVNFRQGWRGFLWQGRFSSVVMDERHLMAAARYVERNPVRARMAARAEDWPWSSAAAHVAGKPDALAESAWLTERTAGWICTWREYLLEQEEREWVEQFRRHQTTGRPMGDESFLKTIGRRLARNLIPKKPGPAPKKPATKKQR